MPVSKLATYYSGKQPAKMLSMPSECEETTPNGGIFAAISCRKININILWKFLLLGSQ